MFVRYVDEERVSLKISDKNISKTGNSRLKDAEKQT